jgi:hypothetical protein
VNLGLREHYAIQEFRDARQALDGYYGSLQAVARAVKLNRQDEYDMAVSLMITAKARLRRAIDALKLGEEVAQGL